MTSAFGRKIESKSCHKENEYSSLTSLDLLPRNRFCL